MLSVNFLFPGLCRCKSDKKKTDRSSSDNCSIKLRVTSNDSFVILIKLKLCLGATFSLKT